MIWQGQGDQAREALAMQQLSQALISQAYKKSSEGKAPSSVAGLVEKARKAVRDGIEIAKEANEKIVEAHIYCIASQMHAIVEGELDETYYAAKYAYDLFREVEDDKGAAYAQFFMAQGEVLQEKWEKALKDATSAMKVFKKTRNEEGQAVCQTLLDKIEKSMPKPEPVFIPQPGLGLGWMPMGGKGQGKGKSAADMAAMQAAMQAQQAAAGGGQVMRKREGGSALDLSNVSEEIIAAKVKEVALAIIGEGDELDVDTPLMEAGLTSSTAVVLKDEVSEEIPGISLPPTLIFDYPSVSAIAEFVMEKLGK